MGWDRNKRKIRGLGARFTSGVAIDSGGITLPVVLGATTVATLTNQGVSIITATTAKGFALAAPTAGAFKVIVNGSTLGNTVTCAAGTYFQASTHADAAPSTASDVATFNDGADCLTLMGLSTVRWAVIGNIGSVSLG